MEPADLEQTGPASGAPVHDGDGNGRRNGNGNGSRDGAAAKAGDGASHGLAAVSWETILDRALEEGFGRLTRLAVNVLHVPVAMVNLAGSPRKFLSTSMGHGGEWERRLGNELFHSFCEKVIASGEPPLVV